MTLQDYADTTFLALTIWREARGESAETRAGVAHAIMNRVRRPAWWGDDVMSVIFKKWQFSSLTDPNDKQLTAWPRSSDVVWIECLEIADRVFKGIIDNPVPGADSYYDVSIPPPYWATAETFVAQLGRVRFYNLDLDVEARMTEESAGKILQGHQQNLLFEFAKHIMAQWHLDKYWDGEVCESCRDPKVLVDSFVRHRA